MKIYANANNGGGGGGGGNQIQVICDVTAGAWERNFNAVSHKPKLTGTD